MILNHSGQAFVSPAVTVVACDQGYTGDLDPGETSFTTMCQGNGGAGVAAWDNLRNCDGLSLSLSLSNL